MKLLFIPNGHAKITKNMRLGFERIGTSVIFKNNPSAADICSVDVVYSAATPLSITDYPNTRFIFGPNFTVFPNAKTNMHSKHNNAIYIQPSQWVKQLWLDLGYTSLPLEVYPVGVDTELFKPIKTRKEREQTFIYLKSRKPEELQLLKKHFPEARVFTYGSYSEADYREYLQNAKFGIWLAAHESEGFALLEALSSGVPLLVWSVTKMSQEMGCPESYKAINTTATTVPYWDERCGEVFYDRAEFLGTKERFLKKLEGYKPREYILDNLSVEKTARNFLELCETGLFKQNVK